MSNIFSQINKNPIKIDLDLLSRVKIAVKRNFEKIESVREDLEKLPFLRDDINHRMETGILFQPGRIVETMVVQSLASTLSCEYAGDGIYDGDIFTLLQDGGSGMSDLTILDKRTGIFYIFEIKEPSAYGKSCGFTYDDDGKPVDFTTKNEEYRDYVNSLFKSGGMLEKYNILENQGHNKVFSIDDVITNDFDFIVSYDSQGFLKIMSPEEYRENYDFRIEVRSNGRNTRKVFTPNKLDTVNGMIRLEKSLLNEIQPRGGSKPRKYKYVTSGAIFSFSKSKVFCINDEQYVKLSDVKQHVGEIAIQHHTKKDV